MSFFTHRGWHGDQALDLLMMTGERGQHHQSPGPQDDDITACQPDVDMLTVAMETGDPRSGLFTTFDTIT